MSLGDSEIHTDTLERLLVHSTSVNRNTTVWCGEVVAKVEPREIRVHAAPVAEGGSLAFLG
jgi:hypothetical protein